VKRRDLVRELENAGCVLIDTASATIFIAIRTTGGRLLYRDTGKSQIPSAR
jgi:hypothetical protein